MTADEESKLYAETLRWMARAKLLSWPPCAPKHWSPLDLGYPLDASVLAGIDFKMLDGVKWFELKSACDEWKARHRREVAAEIAEVVAFLVGLCWLPFVSLSLACVWFLAGLLFMSTQSKRSSSASAKRIQKALAEVLQRERPDLAAKESW